MICLKCRQDKTIEEFARTKANPSNPLGVRPICLACTRRPIPNRDLARVTSQDLGVEIRDIGRFPNYAVTSDGLVWSHKTRRWVKCSPGPGGYWGFPIYNTTMYLHIEVLTAFIGPRPVGLLGLHKDDDKANNRLSNLEWGTYTTNNNQSVLNGKKGKLSKQQVLDIRALWGPGQSTAQIAADFKVTPETIRRVIRGHSYKYIA